MEFYLVLCADRFYVYGKGNEGAQSFDGNPFFEYEPSKIASAMEELLDVLVENNNLTGREDMRFILIESNDSVKNDVATGKLEGLILGRSPIEGLLQKVMEEFSKDPKKYMELGINYDGKSYLPGETHEKFGEFNLLSLTVEPDALLKYV